MFDMLIGAAVEVAHTADRDREWAVNRPSRGTHARVVTEAVELPRAWQGFAECVEERESKGFVGIVNTSSGAQGLYQFMPAWNHGLPYMVADRLREYGMPNKVARGVREWLSARPISDWPGVYQRIGFAAVIKAGGADAAQRHWGLAGSPCNRLIP